MRDALLLAPCTVLLPPYSPCVLLLAPSSFPCIIYPLRLPSSPFFFMPYPVLLNSSAPHPSTRHASTPYPHSSTLKDFPSYSLRLSSSFAHASSDIYACTCSMTTALLSTTRSTPSSSMRLGPHTSPLAPHCPPRTPSPTSRQPRLVSQRRALRPLLLLRSLSLFPYFASNLPPPPGFTLTLPSSLTAFLIPAPAPGRAIRGPPFDEGARWPPSQTFAACHRWRPSRDKQTDSCGDRLRTACTREACVHLLHHACKRSCPSSSATVAAERSKQPRFRFTSTYIHMILHTCAILLYVYRYTYTHTDYPYHSPLFSVRLYLVQ